MLVFGGCIRFLLDVHPARDVQEWELCFEYYSQGAEELDAEAAVEKLTNPENSLTWRFRWKIHNLNEDKCISYCFKMEKNPPIFMWVNKKDFLPSPLERLGLSSLSQKDMPKRKSPTKWTLFFGVLMSCSFLKGSNKKKNRQHIWGASKDRNLVEIWFDRRKNYWLKDHPFLLELGLFSGAT